jgi:hypothetical protein
MIFDGEIASGPATSPTLHLSSGQTDRFGRLVVSQGGLLIKKQHQPKAWDGLDRDRSAGHGVKSLLHEIVREGTQSGTRSWHGGILSLPGFLGVHLPLPKVHRNHDVICETDHLGCDTSSPSNESQNRVSQYKTPKSRQKRVS